MTLVLFESGRPVLMVPAPSPAFLGQRIVIAWNGGGETATAIAHAMPLLRRANEVRVISVGTGLIPGAPPGEALTRNLVWHGIRATAHHIDTKAAAGGVWLEECDAARADLLVKGAYTTSHLRQVIFGGPTRQILTQAELPVLLAH